MEIAKLIFMMFLLLFLAACSKNKDLNKLESITKLYMENNKPKALKTFKKEMFKDLNYQIIEVKTNGVAKQLLILPISSRNNYINYISGQGQSLTIYDDYIIRTNGFNTNFISLENNKFNISKESSYLYDSKKIYSFVTPLYSIKKLHFNCNRRVNKSTTIMVMQKEVKVKLIEEVCSNSDKEFINLFWYDNQGYLWKTRQLISQENIFAETLVLKK